LFKCWSDGNIKFGCDASPTRNENGFNFQLLEAQNKKASRYMRIQSETHLNKTVQSKIEKGYDLCMTVLQKRHLMDQRKMHLRATRIQLRVLMQKALPLEPSESQ